MSTTLTSDPFYKVQADIQSSLKLLTDDHQIWKQLLAETNATAATKHQIRWTTKELKRVVTRHEDTLRELSDSIVIAEKNREKYRLTLVEIENRKRFVRESLALLVTIKHDLYSNSSNEYHKIDYSDNLKELLSSSTPRGVGLEKRRADDRLPTEDYEVQMGGQYFIQQRLYKEQDKGLDQLLDNAKELGEITKTMGTEIKSQGIMLDKLDKRADHSTNTLSGLMRRLDRFMT
ncbi:syntaxin 10 [Cavenderia fasciculata]|uniref:Syntaxin 10 n=1 Tax=Cavenderia fasciculata TaxID=261658 RepID=F4PQF6_CACFS|nr:syntaxin 10 [Cavenderia fasciculata]EGG22619.1 syntaxin 10 [Cavenderia fasciculata]|eukprot:XP_004360470.1 syntaxin 10 [Cavenderia fasciculata]